MQYNHVAVYVSDIDESLKLYRDLLGFVPKWDTVFPNEMMTQELVDDCLSHNLNGRHARFRDVLSVSPEGQKLELVQPIDPPMQHTPRAQRGYPNTGIHEVAFTVTDIDSWFDRVRAAGFETHTEYVWEIAGISRSFMFFDIDGNAIQFVEELEGAEA